MVIFECPECGKRRWGHTLETARRNIDRHMVPTHHRVALTPIRIIRKGY